MRRLSDVKIGFDSFHSSAKETRMKTKMFSERSRPQAKCTYKAYYENMELSNVNFDAYSASEFSTDFGMIVSEYGPKFHDPNEPCCEVPDFFGGCLIPCSQPAVRPTYGTCSVGRHSKHERIDEAGTTAYASIYQRFNADTVKDCLKEIHDSNMYTACNYTTSGY